MRKRDFNLLFLVLTSFFIIFIPTILFSQVDTAWVRRYNGPGNGKNVATVIGVDANGNVYVTGYSYGFGTFTDCGILKYDIRGNLLWERRYVENGWDEATALGVDNYRNIYITGYSYNFITYQDYLTLKYDENGNLLWEGRYNGPGNRRDIPNVLVLDGDGNVYITGRSYGLGTFYDFATLKYDSDGNLLWEIRYNGLRDNFDEAHTLVIDIKGNVYVTGESYN